MAKFNLGRRVLSDGSGGELEIVLITGELLFWDTDAKLSLVPKLEWVMMDTENEITVVPV